MSGTLDEYRSITSDINSSTWVRRLRALFAFMATPLSQVRRWSEGISPCRAFQSKHKSLDAGSIPLKRSGHLRHREQTAPLGPILFTLVGQTIALCGLFGGGLRPAKFHEKRLDIAACQNGKAAQ